MAKSDRLETYELINSNFINLHERWVDMANRELWIQSVDISGPGYDGAEVGVEYIMANKIIKNLHVLRHQSKTEPVIIHLNNCGGEMDNGMAIYDAVMSMPYHITMVAYAAAASMASIILQAADTRLIMPSSCFMFHRGALSLGGETKTVFSNVDYYKYLDEILLDIYVENVRNSPKFKNKPDVYIRRIIKQNMDKKGDVFLTAKEALYWGFVDGIVTDWDELEKNCLKK